MKILLRILIAIFVVWLIVFAYNKDFFTGNMNKKTPPLVIAHRGASGYAPENTLASIHKALEMKADLIEVDIHLSKDGELIVIHDATLDRTTNGLGEVAGSTLADLKKLDAGSWFSEEFKNENVPTLREVMALINGESVILIEIKKGESGNYRGIEQRTIDLIRELKAESWSIIQSFESEVVQNTYHIAPDLEVHKLITGTFPILPLYHDGELRLGSVYSFDYVNAINPSYQLITQRFINQTHKRGMKVFTYTVNEEKDIQKMIDMGVDGIITNYPDRVSKKTQVQASNSSSKW